MRSSDRKGFLVRESPLSQQISFHPRGSLGQHFPEFLPCPGIVLSFFPFAVSIQGAVVSALSVPEFPFNKFDRLPDYPLPFLAGFPLIGQAIGFDQLGIIIKHFLKMRQGPVTVRGVTTESSRQLIIDPPSAHLIQREYGLLPEF